MRIVFDSDVIVAAIATRGICAGLLEHCFENHEIYACGDLLAEVRYALRYTVKVHPLTLNECMGLLRGAVRMVEPLYLPFPPREEPPAIAAARAARAHYLVTRNEHLLAKGAPHGIRIVEPRAFWSVLRAG